MFVSATPRHPDPTPVPGLDAGIDSEVADRIPADAYYHLIHTLRLALPPPLIDSAGDLARRDHGVIARIAALAPANAVEAELAEQFVAASEQWKACLRLAQLPDPGSFPRAGEVRTGRRNATPGRTA
jgi:hypothetical protein